jgi:hypothetical protein
MRIAQGRVAQPLFCSLWMDQERGCRILRGFYPVAGGPRSVQLLLTNPCGGCPILRARLARTGKNDAGDPVFPFCFRLWD